MGTVEAVLAGFGLACLLVVVAIILAPDQVKPEPEEDPALPYREALAAALRVEEAGTEAEGKIKAAVSKPRTHHRPTDRFGERL